MPVILALLSSALWGISDFVGGTTTRRVSALSVVLVSQLVAVLVIVPFAVGSRDWAHPGWYLAEGSIAGLVGVLSLTLFYRALAVGTMGVVAPIAATGVVVPVAAGIVGGDQPSAVQLVGIAVAIAGVVAASGPELSGGRPGGSARRQSIAMAGVSSIGFGVVMWLIGLGSDRSVPMTLGAMRLTSVTVMTVVLLARRERPSVGARDLPALALVGVFDLSANATYGLATGGGSMMSLMAVLASLYPVVTVLLARQVHGERMARLQSVGVIGALAGVAMIAGGGATA